MRLLGYAIINALHIAWGHKRNGLVIIVLAALCFYLDGFVFSHAEQARKNHQAFQIQYGDTVFYPTSGIPNESLYHTYIHDTSKERIKRVQTFLDALHNEKEYCFITVTEQPIDLKQRIPEIFLYGYEDGTYQESIHEEDNQCLFFTKALQVSDSFFDSFGITLEDGTIFSEEDYYYLDGKVIPVLLGSEYKKVMQLGETFHAQYLGESITCVVKGFLNPNAFFYHYGMNEMISCERYILMPALHFPVAQDSFFIRVAYAQQMQGYFKTNTGFTPLKKRVQELLNATGLNKGYFSITDPNETERKTVLDIYDSMTDQMEKQFHIMVIILTCITVITIGTCLSSIIRSRKEEFGIRLLCGAKTSSILTGVLSLSGIFLLLGDIIASFWTVIDGYGLFSGLGYIQILFFFLWIGVSIFPYYQFKRTDTSFLIGGRE